MVHHRMVTITKAMKLRVAQEMTKATGWAVSADMVRVIDNDPCVIVYATHVQNSKEELTILCCVRDDKFVVREVDWLVYG